MTFDEAVKILTEARVDDARYSAAEIFSEIGGFSRIDISLGRASSENPELIGAVARRAAREPLQYILCFADLYRERYAVDKSCLIPRSDTELLVDIAVKLIPSGESFLDLCTGSGCVAISTLKNTKNTRATMVDISPAALSVAEKNAAANGVSERVRLLEMDVLEELPCEKFFAVLSNPPYVSRQAYRNLPLELYREPEIAFVGGEDGADFYRSLTPRLLPLLKDGGFIAYEIGYDQAEIIRGIARELSLECEIIKDLSGNDRVARLSRKSPG